MEIDRPRTSSNTSTRRQQSPSGQPSAPASLAGRISSWTSKCLLSAVILVAGLGFGREVVKWWAADRPEAAEPYLPATAPDGLADPTRPHLVRFADQPWSLGRRSISGSKSSATAALRACCREAVGGERPGVQDHLDDRPGKAESELLQRLALRKPVEQEPDRWQLYELDDAFPMVVGARQQSTKRDVDDGKNLAAKGRRVVTWGLAFPTGPDAWTLLTFQPEHLTGQWSDDLPSVPLPPESSNTLTIQAAGGCRVVAFAGPRRPETWRRFYDHWFEEHGWRAAGDWQHSNSTWCVRYAAPAQSPAAVADVRFGPDRRGRFGGLLMITAKRTESSDP